MNTLGHILDAVMQECGFRARGNYASSSSQDEQQAFRIANRAVSDIMEHPWSALLKQHQITLTASPTYPLPADFQGLRFDTAMAESTSIPVDINTTPRTWALLKSNIGSDSSVYRGRIFGNLLEIDQPAAGDEISFEYWSNSPILSAGAIPLRRFAADTDLWILDEDLLAQNIIWRFKRTKGLEDWQASLQDYNTYWRTLVSRDNPAKTINQLGAQIGNQDGEPYTDLWLN